MSILSSGLSRDVFPIGEQRQTKLSSPSPQSRALPFYHNLPTDNFGNLQWRIYVRERCVHDLEFRGMILDMCEQDVCFFIETFVYFYEPRTDLKHMPVKMWSDQVDVMAWSQEVFGKRDMGVEKSRGIGVSWLYAALFYWKWRFTSCKLGMVSRDELAVGGPDENSLLGKFQYIHKHMPEWFKVNSLGLPVLKYVKGDMLATNTINGATCQGFVPTDDKLRGGRFTALLFDEFAFLNKSAQALMNSAVHTSPCRFFISTWHGADNDFHVMMRKEPSTMLRCEMYWWNNSERFKGAYRSENGILKLLDPGYQYPKDYPFELDGMLRSPWVDFELRRPGTDGASALEELYGLQAEGQRKLFRSHTVQLVETTARPADRIGKVEKRGQSYKFIEDRNGNVEVWGVLGDGYSGPFSAGCDLGFGRGASLSTFEVIDLSTGEQVIDLGTDDLNPIEFAQYVFAALQWLNGHQGHGHTYLTFEQNGDQAKSFCDELRRLGYSNIMRRDYKTKVQKHLENQYYGMRNKDGGSAIMGELERAVIDGDCIVRSPHVHLEMSVFDRDEDNKPVYPKGEPGHGDRVQGLAMAWVQGTERLIDSPVVQAKRDPYSELREPTEQQADDSWSSAWCGSGYFD